MKHQYLGIHIKMHTPAYFKKHFRKYKSILEGEKKPNNNGLIGKEP